MDPAEEHAGGEEPSDALEPSSSQQPAAAESPPADDSVALPPPVPAEADSSEPFEVRQARALFRKYDKDDSDTIDIKELELLLVDTFDAVQLDKRRRQRILDKFLKSYDINSDGQISWEEFETMFKAEDLMDFTDVPLSAPLPTKFSHSSKAKAPSMKVDTQSRSMQKNTSGELPKSPSGTLSGSLPAAFKSQQRSPQSDASLPMASTASMSSASPDTVVMLPRSLLQSSSSASAVEPLEPLSLAGGATRSPTQPRNVSLAPSTVASAQRKDVPLTLPSLKHQARPPTGFAPLKQRTVLQKI